MRSKQVSGGPANARLTEAVVQQWSYPQQCHSPKTPQIKDIIEAQGYVVTTGDERLTNAQ